jgi:glutamate/tyrosine decarboxylase-like PLP-dependent enzyme
MTTRRSPLSRAVSRAKRGIFNLAFERANKIGPLRRKIERKFDALLDPVTKELRPYGELETHRALPIRGIERDSLLTAISRLTERERGHWEQGQASGAVYHGGSEHVDFLNQVYALTAQSNPLHADIWPSASKFEAEIVSMTATLLGGSTASAMPEQERITGTVTSGGTESIILAMKAYRDRARRTQKRGKLQIVAAASAHAAFDKAAELLDVEVVRVPVGPDYRADVGSMRRAIGPRTMVVVASAPCFPHGVIDPVTELASHCLEQRVGLHVDACLGAFILPWARRLGYPVPDFEFSVPGVTSISADTHKYGYAAKGTSVILFRGAELGRQQYFVSTEWSGGLYFSPTLAGSRPGGLSAACWASLLSLGEEGYLDATRKILDTAGAIREGISRIPDLVVLGDPLFVIAFASSSLDIYRVLDEMSRRGFHLNGLQHPASLHLCVTLRHTLPGVAEEFLKALRSAVDAVRNLPAEASGVAPIYGMAGSFPARGAVAELLRRYVERLYRV